MLSEFEKNQLINGNYIEPEKIIGLARLWDVLEDSTSVEWLESIFKYIQVEFSIKDSDSISFRNVEDLRINGRSIAGHDISENGVELLNRKEQYKISFRLYFEKWCNRDTKFTKYSEIEASQIYRNESISIFNLSPTSQQGSNSSIGDTHAMSWNNLMIISESYKLVFVK